MTIKQTEEILDSNIYNYLTGTQSIVSSFMLELALVKPEL